MVIKNKRDDGSFIQNSDKNQKEKDGPLIIQKNTDKENLNKSKNYYHDNSQDDMMDKNQIGKTIIDEEVGLKKFEKSSRKNITDGPEQKGLERKNEESENLDGKKFKDQNNHMIDGPVQEQESFNLEKILQKTIKNFIDSPINIFLKFLICIVIFPFLMFVAVWFFSDKIIVALFGTISSVDYSRWQKIEDEAENENLCCKGLCKTWCKILFCLWAAFNFIIAPIISALLILFGLFYLSFIYSIRNARSIIDKFGIEYDFYGGQIFHETFKRPDSLRKLIILPIKIIFFMLSPALCFISILLLGYTYIFSRFDQYNGRILTNLLSNLKKKREVKSIVFLFEMKSISKINQFDTIQQELNESIEYIKQGLYAACFFWNLSMLILTPIITLYLIIFWPFLWVCMQLDQVSYRVIKALFHDFEVFKDVQSFDQKDSGCCPQFCCIANNNKIQDQNTQNISQNKEEEEKKIDYSQNRYHRKKIEIIKEKMEERKIIYGDVQDILQKVQSEQTQYEKWLDQDMIHIEDKQVFEDEIKKQKMIKKQEMQEFWKSYQEESNKVKESKIKMQNEFNAWQKFRGVHYHENELQIKVKELNDDCKTCIQKWGTHYDTEDFNKKQKELNQKKQDDLKALEKKWGKDNDSIDYNKEVKDLNQKFKDDLKAWKENRGTVYDQNQLKKNEKEAKEKYIQDLKNWKLQKGEHYGMLEYEKKKQEAQKQLSNNLLVLKQIKTMHCGRNLFLKKEKEAQKEMEENLKIWIKKRQTIYDPKELENMVQREEILKNKLQSYQKDLYIVDITEYAQIYIDEELNAQNKRLYCKDEIEFQKELDLQKNIRKEELLKFWENLLNEPCEGNITEQTQFIEDQMKKLKDNRRDKFVEDELQEWVQKMKNLHEEYEIQLVIQKNAEQDEWMEKWYSRQWDNNVEFTEDVEKEMQKYITQWEQKKRSNDEIEKQTEEKGKEQQKQQKFQEIYQKELNIKLINEQAKQNIADELKQWEIERRKHCNKEDEFENQKKNRTKELLNLLEFYYYEIDKVKITEEAVQDIEEELKEWENERIKRWDQKQSCATFLFELEDLKFEENEDAYELFVKCFVGFSYIIWNTTNFLFQPALLIFYILLFIPVKILLLIGLNLPGNKYNLVAFSFKGKKQYQSNCCALTSIFIVVFIVFYLFIQFQGVGINQDVTQQNMLFSSNKAISKNYSSINYIPFEQHKSMFLQKLPSLQIKNFDSKQDLCSDYNNKNDSAKQNSIQMRIKLNNGTKIVPISQSLQCQSKNYTDEKNNYQFQAISFYLNDDASNWLLKFADPEFYQNQQIFKEPPLDIFTQINNSFEFNIFDQSKYQIVDNSYEIIFNKTSLCKPNTTINAQLIHYDIQLNSEFQSPGNIEDLFIANSAMIGQNTQNINICQASVNSQQIQLRKKLTPEPLDKWQELWNNLNPIGKRGVFYSYTVDNTINYNIDYNEFSFMDSLTHFKFKFAQSKTDFMTKVTLERSTLLKAINNIGSILPLIISIHTFFLALVVPKWFDQQIYKEYKFQLVQLSYLKDLKQTKTNTEKKKVAEEKREKIEKYIKEFYNGKECENKHDEVQFNVLNSLNPQSAVNIPTTTTKTISDQELRKKVDKRLKNLIQKKLLKENKVKDQLNSILSYQGFIDLNFHTFQQEEKNLEQEKQILKLDKMNQDQGEKIQEQKVKIEGQEKKIQKQEEKIQEQEVKIENQEKKFLKQKQKIQEQEVKIEGHEKKFVKQQEKIQEQEVKILQEKIQEQEVKFVKQQEKIQEQDVKFQKQEDNIQEQEVKILWQEEKIQEQEVKIQNQFKKIQDLEEKQELEIKQLKSLIDSLIDMK